MEKIRFLYEEEHLVYMERQHLICSTKKLLFGKYVRIFDVIFHDDVILWMWHYICLSSRTSFIPPRTPGV